MTGINSNHYTTAPILMVAGLEDWNIKTMGRNISYYMDKHTRCCLHIKPFFLRNTCQSECEKASETTRFFYYFSLIFIFYLFQLLYSFFSISSPFTFPFFFSITCLVFQLFFGFSTFVRSYCVLFPIFFCGTFFDTDECIYTRFAHVHF